MAERPDVTRRDSLADKEVNVNGVAKPATEDSASATHEDGRLNDLDIEKEGGKAIRPEPLRRTVTAQDWNGPDDPENPMNWYDTPLSSILTILQLTSIAGASRRRHSTRLQQPVLASR